MKLTPPPHSLYANASLLRTIALPCLIGLLLSPVLSRAATPTNAVVEMNFSEGPGAGVGLTTTNQGIAGGTAVFAELAGTNPFPAFSTNVPVGAYVPANAFSIDFGSFVSGAEGRAVDLTNTVTAPGDGRLGALPKLTVSGWVNCRLINNTRGQIAYALETAGGLGFSLAINSVGKFGLGVNQNASSAPASVFALPTDAAVGSNNWVFFAAVYDPSLTNNQLKYYVGRGDKLAALDSSFDYVGGDTFTNVIDFSGPLTIGNQSPVDNANRETTSNAGNALFRGLIDEIKIYTNALTLDEIQQAQLNSAVTPVAASIIRQPVNRATPEGQNATFTVDATGSGLLTYQWKTNGVDVPGGNSATLTLESVTMALGGLQVRVGVSNAVGGVLSEIATLTVLSADPHLMYLSFVEGTEQTTNSTIAAANQNIHTANVGVMQGGSRFRQNNSGNNGIGAGTYPVFGSYVPAGPFAPNPVYNRFSLNMGDVRYTNFPSGLVSGQGNRWLDFTNTVGSPVNTLGAMNGLTICGWLNAGSLTFRGVNSGMGAQIVFAAAEPSRSGFALSHKSSWALQLNVNEWPGGALNHSTGVVPVVAGSDGNAIFPETNWIFFAVTYDGTLTSQNLNYYFGKSDVEVALDSNSPQDYNRGVITNTGPLTVGNCNGVTTLSGRTINGDNAAFFRGFIDELHVFNRVLTLAEIKLMQKAPALPNYLHIARPASDVVLSWEAGQQPLLPAVQLQSRTNLSSGAWADVTTPTNVSGSIRSLTVPTAGDAQFFRLRTK